jgi:capsular polysaccharide biosynthesis protein
MTVDNAPELQDYLAVLWRRKWLIMAITVIAVTAVLFNLSRQAPTYQSGAEVLVKSTIAAPGQSNGVVVMMEDEQRVATSAEVAALAMEQLRRADVAVGQISVAATTTNHALAFTAVSTDPASAQMTAQAYADSYLEFRRKQMIADFAASRDPIQKQLDPIGQQLDDIQRQIAAASNESEKAALISRFTFLLSQQSALQQSLNQLRSPANLRIGDILQPAQLPISPAGPRRSRTIALAVFVGLCLGAGAAFLRDRLDRRVRGRRDLQSLTEVPVLAVVPPRPIRKRLTRASERGGINTAPAAAEAYRRLGRRVLVAAAERRLTSLIVTSPGQEAWDSATAANLGVALTEVGKTVVLVAAEPEPLQLPKHFSRHAAVTNGNSRPEEVFRSEGEHPPDRDLRSWMKDLWSIRQGLSALLLPDNPALLAPREMKELIGELQGFANFVIIDFPHILESPDALALTAAVDAVLYVTDAKQTTRGAAAEGMRQLRQAGAWVIGTVFTNASARQAGSHP